MLNKFIFILFASMIFVPCLKAESYLCLRDDRQRSHLISWNDRSVSIDQMNFTIRSSSDSSKIEIDSEQVAVKFIQDTSQFRLERPSGKIIRFNDKKLDQDIRTRGYGIRYHAIVPVLNTYIFNRKEKTLMIRLASQPPRMTAKYSWESVPTQQELRYGVRPKLVKNLSKDEAVRIFSSSPSEHFYPKCEKQKGFVARLWHTISTFLFP